MPVFMDLETRSTVDLKLHGGAVYARDDTTEILSAVFVSDETWAVWTPGIDRPVQARSPDHRPVVSVAGREFPEELRPLLREPWIAHNAYHFDALVWRAAGLPEPPEWYDSMNLCARRGLPRGLNAASQAALGRVFEKDKIGHSLMLSLCRPNRKTGQFIPLSPMNLGPLVSYNVKDVELLERIWEQEFRPIPEFEARWDAAQNEINRRGIPFDAELARRLIEIEESGRVYASEEAGVERAQLRSTKQLEAILLDLGIHMPNFQKATVEEVISELKEDHPAVPILEARLVETKTPSRKLKTGLAMMVDDVLPFQFNYHKAHTGREGGRGFQPHNIVKSNLDTKEILEIRELIRASDNVRGLRFKDVSSVVAGLVRPCLSPRPGLGIAAFDFQSIESVGLAWCAGDEEYLDQFRAGADPYVSYLYKTRGEPFVAAYAEERGISFAEALAYWRKMVKPVVLGAGYQAGPVGIRAYYEGYGIDLEAANLDPQAIVYEWRDANPLVAGVWTGEFWEGHRVYRGGLWKDVEAAAKLAVTQGVSTQAGRCLWKREGPHLVCRLPSGRELVYRNARLDDGRQIYFDRAQYSSVFRSPLWGGRLVENIDQAICRDLLVFAILNLLEAGYDVGLHVHDEIGWIQEEDFDLMQRGAEIMIQPPTWATGFPIAASGFWADCYLKNPPPGVKELKVRNW